MTAAENERRKARDPIAEQDEAAHRFKEVMGRKPSDPSPPGFLQVTAGPDGQIEAHTYGERNPLTEDVDWFERRGIPRTHHDLSELPTGVFGRFPAGTDPAAALSEVFGAMFGDDDMEPLNSESPSVSG